ncbi:LOG family protein [Salibacterium aidingense]|uniref:LOG family protein n=1 Tax=Salibacterium aidingense TaxID=384933 RepID=UPI0003FF04AA|nr:TIGR00730 family Rossman fold protein [Salibacterium aidingense]
MVRRIAVFCGSSKGASDTYEEGAAALGKELARREITLVYGGASVGLMGALADAVLSEGGKVIGVIPKTLRDKEIAHPNLTELIVVDSMHERKAKMAELADGFIALPGGPGTLEEFVEIFTWGQLGLHQKPLGLLNINNYYGPLAALFDHMTEQQFLAEKYRSMAVVESDPANLIEQFQSYQAPSVKRYIDKEQS